jgi:hypothetical protein
MTATLTWTTSCHEHIYQILLPNKLFAFIWFSLRHSLRHSAWAGVDLDIKTRRKERNNDNSKIVTNKYKFTRTRKNNSTVSET